MSRKTRKLIWSAPLVAVFAVIGALAIFAAQPPAPAAADNPAGVPTGLTAEPAAGNDGRTMLVLDWTAPADVADDPVFGYRIDVSDDGHVWEMLEANTESTDTDYTHTVKGAAAPGNTMYYRVFAINTSGTGPVSKTVSGTTKPETPPMAPTNFTATAAGPEQINLSWSPPADNGGQPITGYCVHISARAVQDAVVSALPTASAADVCTKDTGDTTTAKIEKVGADKTSYMHEDLDELRAYQYRVFAMNKHGADPDHDSATRQAKTTAANQPDAPTGLTAVRQAEGIVDLYWYAPASDGGAAAGTALDADDNGITGYRVEVSKKSNTWPDSSATADGTSTDGTVTQDITAATTTVAVIDVTGASDATAYNLRHTTNFSGTDAANTPTLYYRVFAISNASRGTPYTRSTSGNSARVSLRANDTQPAPVTAITLANDSGSPAGTSTDYDKNKLSWTAGPVTDNKNKTTSYRIDISTNGNDWSQVAGDTRLTSPQYTHENLKASSARHYRILPFNGSTPGEAAKPTGAFTTAAAAAPGDVKNVKAMAVNPGQIDLTWSMVTEDNGSKITNYRIHKLDSATEALNAVDGDAANNVLKMVGADVTMYSDKGLDQDTKYYYAVVAINRLGAAPGTPTPSGSHEVANATTPEAVKPGAPIGLATESAKDSNLVGSGDRGVLLVWNSPGDPAGAAITGYRIDRKVIGKDADYVQLEGSISAARTFYTDALEPAADEQRVYRVSAINVIGVGPVSNMSYYPHGHPHMVAPPNVAPTRVGTISPVTVTAGMSTDAMDVSGYFSDADGDTLTYTAMSSMPSYATVSVSGSMVTITGVAAGSATVTVTATDPAGAYAMQTIAVTVNTAPMAVGMIDPVTVTAGMTTDAMDLSMYFSDADGDDLTYTAMSDMEMYATAMIATDDTDPGEPVQTLTITGVAEGSATITVTATDPAGASAMQTIMVTVESANTAPMAGAAIADQTVTAGEMVMVQSTITDADMGDTLTWSVMSDMEMYATATVDNMGMVTITGVAAGMATITVTATDMEGESAMQTIMITVEAAPVPLVAPTITGTNPVGSGIVLVSWDPVASATGYSLIATNLTNPDAPTRTAAAGADASSGQIQGLTVGDEYLVFVGAFNDDLEFELSDYVRVTAE